VRQSKTKELLDIPCHPVLRAHLSGLKRRGVQICTNVEGLPYRTANALSGVVRRVVQGCDAIPDNRSMHGLKYAAGARMEEAHCTIGQIISVLGNRTYQMAVKYATQRRRAGEAVERTAKVLNQEDRSAKSV
jgi:predicted transcriptional regulator